MKHTGDIFFGNGYDIPITPREQTLRDERDWDLLEGEQYRRPEQVAYMRAMPYKEFLKTLYSQKVKQRVYQIRGYRCSGCNKTQGRMDVHHRTYEHHGRELDHLGDLRILCETCHKTIHGKTPTCEHCGYIRGKGHVVIYDDDKQERRFPCPICDPTAAAQARRLLEEELIDKQIAKSAVPAEPPPRPPQVITLEDVRRALDDLRTARRAELARRATKGAP